MNAQEKFNQMLEKNLYVTIANSTDIGPSIRAVSYYHDPQNKGVLYFACYKQTPKTFQFEKDNKVAFLIQDGKDAIRVNHATVIKSEIHLAEFKDIFITKFPGYKNTYERSPEAQDLYEIHYQEAIVLENFREIGKVIV